MAAALLVFAGPGEHSLPFAAVRVAVVGAFLVSPVPLLWFRLLPRPRARSEQIAIGLTIQALAGVGAIWLVSAQGLMLGNGHLPDVTGGMVWTAFVVGVACAVCALAMIRLTRWLFPRVVQLSAWVLGRGPGAHLVAVLALDVVAGLAVYALLGGIGDPATFVALAVVAVVAALAVFLWLPAWQASRWPSEIEAKDRVELEGHARASVAQLLGGLGLIATLALTVYQVNAARQSSDRTLQLTARGQINDRFSRAIEQFGVREGGKPALERRLGGIYALQQFVLQSEAGGSAEDAATAYRTAAAIFSAYLRANRPRETAAPRPSRLTSKPCSPTRPQSLPPDIAAVVGVLRDVYPADDAFRGGQARRYRQVGPQLDLANADLGRADLRGIDLRGADLRNARLFEAQVSGARIVDAKMAGVDARGACFEDAYLASAKLTEGGTSAARRARASDLRGADFSGAFVERGDLGYADLRVRRSPTRYSSAAPSLTPTCAARSSPTRLLGNERHRGAHSRHRLEVRARRPR